MRILVTDGDSRSALASVRSLGRAGHLVFSASDVAYSLCSASRFCHHSEVYPSPGVDPEGFVSSVREMVGRHQIDLLMPMTEISTLLIAKSRSELPSGCLLPLPSFHAIERAADKCEVLRVARSLGIPSPRSIEAGNEDECLAAAACIGYPVVLKAGRSRIWDGARWVSTSTGYAGSSGELSDRIRNLPAEAFPILVQERVQGPGVGVFICAGEHGTVASFAHQRLREKPPSGGQSVLSESIAADPVALRQAERLLRELDWFGVAMVEFKQDLRDGSLKLMEINGRFWGSLQLAIDSGVDFPNLLADLATGKSPPSPPGYRVGTRLRWLWGDVDSLLAVLLKSRNSLGLTASHPGRLRSLLALLAIWRPGTRYELERAGDIGPAWCELRRRLPFR